MANRTVKVGLEAEVGKFVREMDRAESKTAEVADELNDLTKAGDLDGVAGDLVVVAGALDDAGDSARQAARHVDKLDAEINRAKQDLVFLAAAFAEAGDEAQRLDISKHIERTEGSLRRLSKNRSMLAALIPKPAEVVEAATAVGKTFGQSIKGGLEGAGPQVKIALIGAAVLASPFIGAAISGAVVGGVGIGGIAGGIALAARDPKVQSAGKALGARLLSSLTTDAEVLVDPVLEQIDKIGDRFDELRPRFKRIFANAAEYVEPLTDGLLEGVEGLVEGIDVLMDKGGPAIEAMGDLFAELGDASGDTLAIMAGGSEDAASALDLLAGALGSVVRSIGLTMRGLTEAYGAMDWFGQRINDDVRGVLGLSTSTKDAGDNAKDAADSIATLGENTVLMGMKAAGAEGPIVTLSDQINGLADASRNAFDATTNWGAALDAATEAAAKNGKTLDANTKAGRDNRQALSALARSAQEVYNAEVALTGAGDKANRVANQQRSAFIKVAMSMGESRKAAERLADQFGLIKAPPPMRVNLDAAQAIARAKAIQNELRKIQSKTIRVHVARSTGEVTYGSGGGRQAPQMALGGPVLGSGPKGRDSELRMLAPGEHIWTAAEVDAVGGHSAMARIRRSAISGGDGASLAAPQIMRGGGGTTTIVHEHRVILEGRGSVGQWLVGELRNQPGTAATLAARLGVKKS